MRNAFALANLSPGKLVGSRTTAIPLRHQVDDALARGDEVVFDFSGVAVTQSFVDELIGTLILKRGPEVLAQIVFKSCSEDVRAIIEFVAADRADQYLKTRAH